MMKSMILIALLAGAAAGGVAALVTGTLVQGEAEAASAVSPDDDLATELGQTLRRIEEQNDALQERLRRLETNVAMVRPERQREVAIDEEPGLAESEELKELVAALRDPSAPPPPNFQENVSRALESIREQEDRDRDERREVAYQERLDDRLADLALELGLTSGQTGDLRDVYVDLSLRQREMMDAAREIGDWGSAREQMRELRDEMDQSLARVLSPSQLEQYNETSGRGRGWGGPGGGFLPPSTSDRGGDDRGGRGGSDRGGNDRGGRRRSNG